MALWQWTARTLLIPFFPCYKGVLGAGLSGQGGALCAAPPDMVVFDGFVLGALVEEHWGDTNGRPAQ